MQGMGFGRAATSLQLILACTGLNACTSVSPSWVYKPPPESVSACAPFGNDGWHIAELRAKALWVDAVWIQQYQISKRQQLQNSNLGHMHYQRLRQTAQLQHGVIPSFKQVARWQGYISSVQLQCVLLTPAPH